jgi:hypothetical protein
MRKQRRVIVVPLAVVATSGIHLFATDGRASFDDLDGSLPARGGR